MELTAQEQKRIHPGIYRIVGSDTMLEPMRRYKPPNLNDPNDGLVSLLNEARTGKFADFGTRFTNFIPTPEEFLDLWVAGYADFRVPLYKRYSPSHLHRDVKGFELQYVNWHPGDRYYAFREFNMIHGDEMDDFEGNLRTIPLVSDERNLRGRLKVNINDYDNERVLEWRDFSKTADDQYRALRAGRKEMEEMNPTFYQGWAFPHNIRDVYRNASTIWTMIGFSPQRVYSKMKDLGFVFPPPLIDAPKNSPDF